LEIPALSRAVLPKPPLEPVSAKLANFASGFYFYLDIGYSPALLDPAGRDGLLDILLRLLLLVPGCSPWILDIPCWLLVIEYWFQVLS